MNGFNMPPGVSPSDIPGQDDEDRIFTLRETIDPTMRKGAEKLAMVSSWAVIEADGSVDGLTAAERIADEATAQFLADALEARQDLGAHDFAELTLQIKG